LREFNIIHICGNGNIDKNLINKNGYKQFEYVNEELPDFMGTADYIISRAGANSIFEFLALRKPTLLIPLSKKSSRGDQILNSKSFEKEGYALILEEEDIKGDILNKKLLELKARKTEFINNMEQSQSKNGVEAIINVLLDNIKK